jgi:hypothetical protein
MTDREELDDFDLEDMEGGKINRPLDEELDRQDSTNINPAIMSEQEIAFINEQRRQQQQEQRFYNQLLAMNSRQRVEYLNHLADELLNISGILEDVTDMDTSNDVADCQLISLDLQTETQRINEISNDRFTDIVLPVSLYVL